MCKKGEQVPRKQPEAAFLYSTGPGCLTPLPRLSSVTLYPSPELARCVVGGGWSSLRGGTRASSEVLLPSPVPRGAPLPQGLSFGRCSAQRGHKQVQCSHPLTCFRAITCGKGAMPCFSSLWVCYCFHSWHLLMKTVYMGRCVWTTFSSRCKKDRIEGAKDGKELYLAYPSCRKDKKEKNEEKGHDSLWHVWYDWLRSSLIKGLCWTKRGKW